MARIFEWVRIYTPGQAQLWRPEEEVPDLPDNSFREWKRVTDPDDETREPGQAWTIRDWQHQGYQRILSCHESFSTHHAPDQPRVDVQHPDIIQVEEMFTYAPPMSDGAHSSSLLFRLSSMAAHVLLNLEILRPRLLSGIVQSVQFLVSPAAVDILVDVKELRS